MLHPGKLVHLNLLLLNTHASRGLFSEGSFAVSFSLQPSEVGRDLQDEYTEVHGKKLNSAPSG